MPSSRSICALWFPVLVACSTNQNAGFGDSGSGGTGPTGNDDSGSSLLPINAGPVGDGSSGLMLNLDTDSAANLSPNAACKAGHYQGTFTGSYSSSLILGIPLKVMGNVDMTLNSAGNPMETCTFAGETSKCSDFFQVSGGTVTGVANQNMIGDAAFGGYPYFCYLTGTLDCMSKKFVGGWIECTYCVGNLVDGGSTDGGLGCQPLINMVGGGIGGEFSGPVTAGYNVSTLSFVNGTWNGAEAVGDVDSGSVIVDGATALSYVVADGGYGIGVYGGSGNWGATYTGP